MQMMKTEKSVSMVMSSGREVFVTNGALRPGAVEGAVVLNGSWGATGSRDTS